MAETGVPPQAPGRRRRWPWIALAVVLVLGLCLRALLPLAVERGVAWGSRRYLGLPARVDNVDFSLLRGSVSIEGLTVGPYPDGVTPLRAAWRPPALNPRNALLHWDRVSVRFSWRALLHHTLHLDDVTVVAPDARLTREADGQIDPLRHARPTAPPRPETPRKAATAPASPPSEPWKIQVDRFSLRRPEIRLVDAASGAEMVHFSLEGFELERVALQGRDLALGGVSISGPVLRVRRDLIFGGQPPERAAKATPTPAGGPAASASATGPAGPPAYRIGRIDIERAEFVLITDAGPLPIALSLHASNVSAQPGQRFPVDLQLEIEKGRIGIRGQAGIIPPAYTGTLSWTNLPFPPLALAAEPDLSRWLRTCSSSGDLKLDLDLGAKDRPDLVLSGRTAVDDLWIADPAGKEVSFKWKRLEIGIHRVALSLPQDGHPSPTTQIALDRLELVDPEVRYTRPSPALEALLAGSEKAPAGTSGPAVSKTGTTSPAPAGTAQSPAVDLTLASLDLRGADLELVDRTVKPQARTRIRGLSVAARDLRYPEMAAQGIRVNATLPQRAPLVLDGRYRPDAANFQLSLKKLDLPAFDPYAAAAGASLEHGQASIETKVRLRGDRIEADSKLLLSKLGVSLRDPGSFQERFGVPIDLALALLRDPSGDIRLSIPVSMQKNEARVGLGSVVASALRQALIGALSAPLKMAGAGLSSLKGGGGGISIEPIPSVPGSSVIPKDASDRIDGIARLLGSRPALALTLRGRAGPADRPGLAEQILVARLEAGEDLPGVAGAGFFARRRLRQALEKRARGETSSLSKEDQALYDKMLAAVPVPEGRLRALAHERADAVRALLVAHPDIEASRVKSGQAAAEGAPAVLLQFEAD